jgi:hypothetical protein
MKVIRDLTTQVKTNNEVVNKRLDDINAQLEQMSEVKQTVDAHEGRIAQLEEANQSLLEELAQTKSQLATQDDVIQQMQKRDEQNEHEIVQLQQYTRCTTLIIARIPPMSHVNIYDVAYEIIHFLGFPGYDIVDCHRMKATDPASNVLVKFASHGGARDVLKSGKKQIRDGHFKASRVLTKFNVTPSSEEKQMSIFQHLCPKIGELFKLARDFAKDAQYKFCWQVDGRIFLRKAPDQAKTEVKNQHQLVQLREAMGLLPTG